MDLAIFIPFRSSAAILRGKECRYGKMHEMKVVAFFTPDTLVKTASSYVASLRSYCPSTVERAVI